MEKTIYIISGEDRDMSIGFIKAFEDREEAYTECDKLTQISEDYNSWSKKKQDFIDSNEEWIHLLSVTLKNTEEREKNYQKRNKLIKKLQLEYETNNPYPIDTSGLSVCDNYYVFEVPLILKQK